MICCDYALSTHSTQKLLLYYHIGSWITKINCLFLNWSLFTRSNILLIQKENLFWLQCEAANADKLIRNMVCVTSICSTLFLLKVILRKCHLINWHQALFYLRQEYSNLKWNKVFKLNFSYFKRDLGDSVLTRLKTVDWSFIFRWTTNLCIT